MRIRKIFLTFVYKNWLLFLSIFLLSLHQASIIAYGEYGLEAISKHSEKLNGIYVSKDMILDYLKEIGFKKISLKLANYVFPGYQLKLGQVV